MEVIEYLKSHSLEMLEKEYGITSKRHKEFPNLVLLKYSQIDSPKNHIIPCQCRGVILDEADDWRIISRPFDRFFNADEGVAAPIDWASAQVQEKCDGCCDRNIVVITEDGEKTIEDICNSLYSGKVLAYDTEIENFVFDEIIGHSVQPYIQCTDIGWYEIKTEDGNTLLLTGNHRVWLPELNCYRRVDELTGEESLLSFEKSD